MEDLERFSEAIKMVERYERFLYQRAMGLALIVNGLVGPSVFFLVLKADSFSVLLGMTPTMFSVASTTLLVGVGVFVNIYLFASARVLSSRTRQMGYCLRRRRSSSPPSRTKYLGR